MSQNGQTHFKIFKVRLTILGHYTLKGQMHSWTKYRLATPLNWISKNIDCVWVQVLLHQYKLSEFVIVYV